MDAALEQDDGGFPWPAHYMGDPTKGAFTPTPLQTAFCILPHRKVLFGGSAGSGKSEALLAAALQYVDFPGYSAIIYRRTYADLSRKGALLDRAMTWLGPHMGKGGTVKFHPITNSFHFSSGATLAFGYMGSRGASESVQGAEYHFVGVDEVTQHFKQDVEWAVSRLRRTAGTRIPLRVRFTGNPGGRGHQWVREDFKIVKNPRHDPTNYLEIGGHRFSVEPPFIGANEDNPFIPARLIDNPFLDQANYIQSLSGLDPITKAQLLDGDWDSSPTSRYRREWFTRYTRSGDYLRINGENYLISSGNRFTTVDVAVSVREGVGGEKFTTGGGDRNAYIGEPCWTVFSTWTIIDRFLILLDVTRVQIEAPDIVHHMTRISHQWRPNTFYVEGNGVGRPVAQLANSVGLPCQEVWTTVDKIQNSYQAANIAKSGRLILPDEQLSLPWLKDLEGELFTWTGHKEETSDQIDTISTAGKIAADACLPRIDSISTHLSLPTVHTQNRGWK